MRERQPLGDHLDASEKQQIHVDRPRPVARTAEFAALLALDRLADVQQLLGVKRGSDQNGAVEEVGLVEHLPHRLGLIEGRGRLHRDAVSAQALDRPAQLRLAVADIGAEAEIADPLRSTSVAQTPSSSSDSRSSDCSRVTSTPASWTT